MREADLSSHLAHARKLTDVSLSDSISVGASSGARELLTRCDTGERCSRSFAAGLSSAVPLSLSHGANQHAYDEIAYRNRWDIEGFFDKLKQWRRIATRYDKLAATFLAFVKLDSIMLWLK
jgi:hypothetical protein